MAYSVDNDKQINENDLDNVTGLREGETPIEYDGHQNWRRKNETEVAQQ